jgi:hypothetical protein
MVCMVRMASAQGFAWAVWFEHKCIVGFATLISCREVSLLANEGVHLDRFFAQITNLKSVRQQENCSGVHRWLKMALFTHGSSMHMVQ